MNANPWLKRSVWLLVFGCLVACFWLFPLDVNASSPYQSVPPPVNDNFEDATNIEAFPFSTVVDIGAATLQDDEPQYCNYMSKSVWYRFTPATDMLLRVDTNGSDFSDSAFSVLQGTTIDGLSYVTCASWGSQVEFTANAGQTYYIQAGKIYDAAWGELHLSIVELVSPPNDDFADAEQVTGLPFSGAQDIRYATLEAGEPTPSCAGDFAGKTVWYAYTPPVSGSLYAYVDTFNWPVLAVYTGSALDNLTQIGCQVYSNRLVFSAQAGTTYFFQVGRIYNYDWYGQLIAFHLDVAGVPLAQFGYNPSDPSMFDTVQFYDNSYDPYGGFIRSQAWNFGDSATATGCCPSHRYAADGDYSVSLTIITNDGRTASATQIVPVRTHDVAIVKVGVPTAARTLQTKQVSVGVNSRYYNENVLVELYKSAYGMPDNFEKVGESRQLVQAQGPNKSTQFVFNYTFTAADTQAGTVTFKAVATIVDRRDVQAANNIYISLPVKVSGGKLSGASVDEEGSFLFLPAIAGD
jgi:PKD repeat protein